MNLCREPDAATFLPHVNKDPVAFLGDLPQGGVQLVPAVAAARTEHIPGETFAMDAHQGRARLGDFAHDQSKMIKMEVEVAVIGGQFHDLLRFDQLLGETPIGDKALDRANAQAMLFPELHQLRQASHCSIIVQDFAKNAGGLKSSHAR